MTSPTVASTSVSPAKGPGMGDKGQTGMTDGGQTAAIVPLGKSGYVPLRPPYAHQRKGFELSERERVFAYTMEMRTGKTKLTIDVTAAAFERGSINGLLIVAPKGVDKNWATDEIPTDLPARIPRMVVVYRAIEARTKRFQQLFDDLLKFQGLAVLCANVQASRTPTGRKFLEKFLRSRRTMFALDESSDIKTPAAKQCRAITSLGKLAKARRILDGTPNAENPMELFAQYRFLDPNILGFTNFTAFKARYCVFETEYRFDPKTGKNQEYPKLKEYAHLQELKDKIAPYTYRVRADEVLDMPSHVYQKVHYELEGEQLRVYQALLNEFKAELKSGEVITVRNLLTRYLRLQQVLGNRIPTKTMILCPHCEGEGCEECDGEGVVAGKEKPGIIDHERNPRIEALEAALKGESPAPTILWARFRGEIDDLIALGTKLGRKVCRYDGIVSDDDREAAKRGFQSGEFDWFVGNVSVGGRGLTLSKAELMVYYSNVFALRMRLQSEVRGDAPGKKSVGILDMMADDTIDEAIVGALRSKKKLSDMMMNDPERKWL